MFTKYISLFKHLQTSAFVTAVILLVIHLLLFLGISYGFSQMPATSVQTKFEKYLMLGVATCHLIYFGLSLVLSNFTIHINYIYLRRWLKIYTAISMLYLVVGFGSSIYIIVEGTVYIGISILITTLLIGTLNGHTIIIIFGLYKELTQGSNRKKSTTNISYNNNNNTTTNTDCEP